MEGRDKPGMNKKRTKSTWEKKGRCSRTTNQFTGRQDQVSPGQTQYRKTLWEQFLKLKS